MKLTDAERMAIHALVQHKLIAAWAALDDRYEDTNDDTYQAARVEFAGALICALASSPVADTSPGRVSILEELTRMLLVVHDANAAKLDDGPLDFVAARLLIGVAVGLLISTRMNARDDDDPKEATARISRELDALFNEVRSLFTQAVEIVLPGEPN